MNIPDRVNALVETFDQNIESNQKGTYNETLARREFIDPFFEELGWNVANRQGYAEAYKDVIQEDAIKVGSVTKAPDYCFRIGGTSKFYLEAKKPRPTSWKISLRLQVAPIRLERQAFLKHPDGFR